MHVPYLKNVPNPCMLHACFRNHACNMHEISNYSITLSLEISCMELSGFGRMKCAETCMKHASFRRSILSRAGSLFPFPKRAWGRGYTVLNFTKCALLASIFLHSCSSSKICQLSIQLLRPLMAINLPYSKWSA